MKPAQQLKVNHEDSLDSTESVGSFSGAQHNFSQDEDLNHSSGSVGSRPQESHAVGNQTSVDQGFESRQNSISESKLMSQEGVFQLTKDLRKFSEALTALKSVFLEDRNNIEKTLRVLAHERLGDLLKVLKMVVDKYAELNSTEILSKAAELIKHIKEFNYEDIRSDVSPDIFRAINNLAMAFSNSVSECLMGDSISPKLSMTPSHSFDNLEQGKGEEIVQPSLSEEAPTLLEEPSHENVDAMLQNMEQGLEMAFERTKILSKYLNDLLVYVKKKASLEMEHSKNVIKLSQQTKTTLSEQSYLPFQSLYCTHLDHDREFASNMHTTYQNLLLQQKFLEPLQAKKNEQDKRRKQMREGWIKEKRKAEDMILIMKKSQQHYLTRVQEYQKAKESAIKAEFIQGQTNLPPKTGVLSASTTTGKMERKKKQEEEASLKATQAEHEYKAYVGETNKRLRDLERSKVRHLQDLKDLMIQCDQTAKTVTTSFFYLHHQLYVPLPVQFDAMCHEAKRYEPGFQYSDYIRNLPVQPYSPRVDYMFQRSSTEGSQYLVQQGQRTTEEDYHHRNTYAGHRRTTAFSDTESSSSRSLDDISPSAPRKDDNNIRRPSTEGSLSSEDILDDGHTSAATLALPDKVGVSVTPESSPVPVRQHFKNRAAKVAVNVGKAFTRVKKAPKSTIFGVDFAVATQDCPDGIPFLVKSCIAEIDNRALEAKGIYRVNGVKNRVEKLCAQFDSAPEKVDLTQQSPHDVSGVLKYFLRQLPEPLLKFDLYPNFLQIAKDYQGFINDTNKAMNDAKEAGKPLPPLPSAEVMDSYVTRIRDTIASLPIANKNTLQYIISHLTRISAHSTQNKMTSSNLAIVFGPTLLRPMLLDGNESLKTLIDMPYQSRIVEMLIVHKDFVFGTHSHQAANMFPFSGFQHTPSSYSPTNTAQTATVAPSAVTLVTTDGRGIPEGDITSVSDLSVTQENPSLDKNVSHEGDILLNFDEESLYTPPSGETQYHDVSSEFGDNITNDEPGEIVSNSPRLIEFDDITSIKTDIKPGMTDLPTTLSRPVDLDLGLVSGESREGELPTVPSRSKTRVMRRSLDTTSPLNSPFSSFGESQNKNESNHVVSAIAENKVELLDVSQDKAGPSEGQVLPSQGQVESNADVNQDVSAQKERKKSTGKIDALRHFTASKIIGKTTPGKSRVLPIVPNHMGAGMVGRTPPQNPPKGARSTLSLPRKFPVTSKEPAAKRVILLDADWSKADTKETSDC